MAEDKLTAEDVKQALRARHPEGQGEWMCFEEPWNIDFLAIRVWGGASHSILVSNLPAESRRLNPERQHRRIGYEVKVSRSDMRRELLKPSKRSMAVESSHEFYFAVPKGLLKPAERSWLEPEWEPGDFERTECPGLPYGGGRHGIGFGGPCRKVNRRYARYADDPSLAGKHIVKVPVPTTSSDREHRNVEIVCPSCGGVGHLAKSRVEREAPNLWIPRDCGLIEVWRSPDGELQAKAVRKAPVRVPRLLTERAWVELARMGVNPTRIRHVIGERDQLRESNKWMADERADLRRQLEAAHRRLVELADERPVLGSVWRGPWPTYRKGERILDARVLVIESHLARVGGAPALDEVRVHVRWDDHRRCPDNYRRTSHTIPLGVFLAEFTKELSLV